MKAKCLYILFSFSICFLQSQQSNLKFENLDTKEGLSSSTCVELFQDSNGVLWIGTNDGLNKYDGYSFEIYRPIINDQNSISNNRINTITEDFNNKLWVGTDDGLNVLDKDRNIFFRIQLFKDVLQKVIVNDLLFDELTSNLWVATNNGISKIALSGKVDLKNLKIEHFQNKYNDENSLSQNNITSVIKDSENQIWFISQDNFLNKYNSKDNNFSRNLINIPSPKIFDHLPKAVMVDNDGDFWIGNNLSYLIHWNRKTDNFQSISLVNKNITIFDIYQDSKGVIWIATDGDGLYTFDKKTKQIQHILNSSSNPFSLPNNQPSKIFEDKKGIFWIASYNKGISKLVLSKSFFGHYFHEPGKEQGMSDRIAQAVLEDSNKRIWIGTGRGGLNLFNEEENSFISFRSNPNNPNTISSDKILSLSECYDGSIWVGTWDGGLNKFNPKINQFKRYLHDPKKPFSIGQNTVWSSIEDSKKRLWFGTSKTGLNLFDPVSKKFYNYKNIPEGVNTIPSDFVFHLSIDSKNRLLVGTSLGLCYVNLDNLDGYIPNSIQFQKIEEKSIQNIRINYVSEDHFGNYWVGTDLGLYKLDSNFRLLKSYSTKNGLPNNIIIGVIEDDNYKIWVTTKGGVSIIDPIKQIFTNYNTNDGLQGIEFQSKSVTKTNNGRLLMGGLNGFNLFNPSDIFSSPILVKPTITNLKLFNETVNVGDIIGNRVILKKPIKETQEFILNYDEGFMTFDFVALNYKNPEQTQYAYKLDGLEESYINAGNSRSANYSNLLPGNYTFEVMASIDGQWVNAQSSKVNFTILPPPWRTWWAYMLYFIIAVLFFWIVTRYYTQKVKEDQRHELDQMKLQFFINVSHEFRTPLTLILNPVDKILSSFNNSETIKSSAHSIQRSARRLLHLVNQLLDHRKMDVGMSPLQLEKGDILKFSKDIFLLFKDLAERKNISYEFNSSSKKIISLFDFDKVEKIITNLISNAIKFTNSGGQIIVSVNSVKENKSNSKFFLLKNEKLNECIEIVVKDSGLGLNEEQLKNVFSRFYNADPTKSGTGIGLNFTKALVDFHGGEIQVRSKLRKGSEFIVKLPLNLDAKFTEVENEKNEFLINSMKAVEYDLLTSNEVLVEDKKEEVINQNEKLPILLIVEDNKELRVHLKNDLKDAFLVKEAKNGEEGLKMVKKYFPDIVISDVMMPKMDGFEMCKLIKTELETCHIPVILLTARALEDDRIEGYENGADEYLPKPFQISILIARVKNLLEAKKRIREKFSKLGATLPFDDYTTNSIDQVFLEKVTNVVLENISIVDFKLDDIVEEISLGRSQFYRKMQSITGQNPSNFVRTLRLNYASELLIQNKYSIKEITFMSGFNSTSYFGKTFKEKFGLTPREFIKKNSN